MSVGEVPRMLVRKLKPPPGSGLGTTVQDEPPVQCSMRVPLPPTPAAQTLHADSMVTALRWPRPPGLAGCPPVQAWQAGPVAAVAAPDPSPVSTPPSSSGGASTRRKRPVCHRVRIGSTPSAVSAQWPPLGGAERNDYIR